MSLGFWNRVEVGGPEDCWPWRLSTGNHGYGQWWPARLSCDPVFDTNWLSHRLAWFLTRGPIPPGWTIDHLCRNRRCCNPAHLRLLTNVQNASLNGNAIKTECLRGHAYDEWNTYVDPKGHRRCRACAAARKKAA